jgi:hypothetical protein
MANVKFSDFAVRTTVPTVDYIVGYQGAANIQIAPTDFLGDYLPLTGGTLVGKLEISYLNPVFDLQQSGATKFRLELDGANDTYMTVFGAGNKMFLRTDSTTALTLDGNQDATFAGNVGIGVTPTTLLDIGGMADPIVRIKSDVGGDPQLRFDGSAANRSGLIKFWDNGSSAGGFIDYHHNGDKMNFGAGSGSTITMTVIEGAVGIGTDSPAHTLDVKGLDLDNTTIARFYSNTGTRGSFIIRNGVAVSPTTFIGTAGGSEILHIGTNNTVALTLDGSQDATFAGNVGLATGQVQLGTLSGGDLKLYWDGADGIIVNKTGHLKILNQSDDKSIYFQTDDGAGGTTNYIVIDGVSEYTQFDKNTRHMDNVYSQFGNSNDANIYHNGTDWYFTQGIDDGDMNFRCDDGAGGIATYMFLDGGEVLTRFLKGANFNDNVKLTFGDVTTPGDLEIYHDGINSYIQDTGTGNMYINFYERLRFQDFAGGGGTIAAFNVDSSGCQLYYIGALKIQTTNTGTVVTGQMNIAALNTAPASAGDTGTLGEIRYTADYIYVCTATDTWKRSALSTW